MILDLRKFFLSLVCTPCLTVHGEQFIAGTIGTRHRRRLKPITDKPQHAAVTVSVVLLYLWPFSLLSSEKKHVITIIRVVNLVAGRRRKRGIVMAVAPSHLQTSGLVNVMGPTSISDSFRPTVRVRPSILTNRVPKSLVKDRKSLSSKRN